MSKADLHIHSTFSDGSDSPEQIVALAVEKELGCIALTDHDIIAGIEKARKAAQGKDVEVLSGVELSTDLAGTDIHILGYCFDIHNAVLNERLKLFCQTRVERVREMVDKLDRMGMPVSEEEILSQTDSDAVGRLHVARVMLKKGYVSTIEEAFHRYIVEGKPAFVPKFKQTPFEAIDLIRQAGGVAVMAHPMVTMRDEVIPSLVKAGLKGLEVYYPNTSKKVIQFYERIADKHGLIKTGGSDAHGRFRDYSPIGMVRVDYSIVEALKNASTK